MENNGLSRFISADDHIDLRWLPKDLWSERLPSSLRDRGPRVVQTEKGECWSWEGQVFSPHGYYTAAPDKHIPGFADLYGEGVHHCPYCDGWEYSGRRLAAYGRGDAAFGLAQGLTVWTDDVVLCTDGPSGLDDERRAELAASGIDVREEPVTGLESRGGTLTALAVADANPE